MTESNTMEDKYSFQNNQEELLEAVSNSISQQGPYKTNRTLNLIDSIASYDNRLTNCFECVKTTLPSGVKERTSNIVKFVSYHCKDKELLKNYSSKDDELVDFLFQSLLMVGGEPSQANPSFENIFDGVKKEIEKGHIVFDDYTSYCGNRNERIELDGMWSSLSLDYYRKVRCKLKKLEREEKERLEKEEKERLEKERIEQERLKREAEERERKRIEELKRQRDENAKKQEQAKKEAEEKERKQKELEKQKRYEIIKQREERIEQAKKKKEAKNKKQKTSENSKKKQQQDFLERISKAKESININGIENNNEKYNYKLSVPNKTPGVYVKSILPRQKKLIEKQDALNKKRKKIFPNLVRVSKSLDDRFGQGYEKQSSILAQELAHMHRTRTPVLPRTR